MASCVPVIMGFNWCHPVADMMSSDLEFPFMFFIFRLVQQPTKRNVQLLVFTTCALTQTQPAVHFC